MWAVLGFVISLVMGGLELANVIDYGWWWIAPFIIGIIIQIIAMACSAGDGCAGCLGGGFDGVGDIVDIFD